MGSTTPRAILAENLLQEGVSSAQAVLFAISANSMLSDLPSDPYARNMHNHAMQLLAMLEDNLRAIQAKVDALPDGGDA